MSQTLDLIVAGETLRLDAERAVYWPRADTLLLADVHLGKGAAYRRAGLAVPSGHTRADLDRIAALIARHRPQRLLVLGDLFHTAVPPDDPLHAAFAAFRAAHAQLMITALRGNHDRATHRLPPDWRIDWHEGPLHEAPFVFAHEPGTDPRGYTLAGHVHPVVKLKTATDALRLPAFCFGEHGAVLPSFGSFTGGWEVPLQEAAPLVVATPDGLVPLR